MYACFSSWKMFSKENKLLKKYLNDANTNLAESPSSTDRLERLFGPSHKQQGLSRSIKSSSVDSSQERYKREEKTGAYNFNPQMSSSS